jgi:FAD/FMN-containing dehydrogenase
VSETGVLASLAAIVGSGNVLADDADKAPYLTDWRGRYHGEAVAIVRPGSTSEAAAVVKLAADHGLCIVPQGGNTGLCGGATPMTGPRPAIVIRLDRMNRIRHVSPLGDSVSVDAGCVLAAVQEAASAADRLFPLSLGAEGSCRIGGNIGTNAGGVTALRYGTMRDLVLGLEVVLADGQVLDMMTALRKDSAGYDLRHLFIGSEGTLGLVTGAVLKLFPKPRQRATAFLKLATITDVLSLLALARSRAGERIGAFEVLNRSQMEVIREFKPEVRMPFADDAEWQVLLELADVSETPAVNSALEALLAESMETGLVSDALIAASDSQSEAFWRVRHSVSEASRAAGHVVSHDSVVPLADQGRFVTAVEAGIAAIRPDARIAIHGHIGDGNLHMLAIIPPVADKAELARQSDSISAIVDEVTMELRGSISAEHGIGCANIARLARTTPPLEIALMQRMKQALDPGNLFNPGKLFGAGQ